jgi:hypothetical protein
VTLGVNLDDGWEADAAAGGPDATWWGPAAYAAYGWTEALGTAARLEYFDDADGYRTGVGRAVGLFEATLTRQYRIWRRLVARVEYRHDEADRRVTDGAAGSEGQDTLALSAFYTFL